MLQLRDIMTTSVVTVGPETTLRAAMDLFSQRHISGAPVVSGGHVLGVVSSTALMARAASRPGVPRERPPEQVGLDDDLLESTAHDETDLDAEDADAAYFTELWDDAGAEVSERLASTDGPEWDALSEHTVQEAMTSTVYSLPPHASVTAAADYMTRVGAHRLLVVEGGTLYGIVSTMDIARAVAEHRLGQHTYVFNRRDDFDGRGWD